MTTVFIAAVEVRAAHSVCGNRSCLFFAVWVNEKLP